MWRSCKEESTQSSFAISNSWISRPDETGFQSTRSLRKSTTNNGSKSPARKSFIETPAEIDTFSKIKKYSKQVADDSIRDFTAIKRKTSSYGPLRKRRGTVRRLFYQDSKSKSKSRARRSQTPTKAYSSVKPATPQAKKQSTPKPTNRSREGSLSSKASKRSHSNSNEKFSRISLVSGGGPQR